MQKYHSNFSSFLPSSNRTDAIILANHYILPSPFNSSMQIHNIFPINPASTRALKNTC